MARNREKNGSREANLADISNYWDTRDFQFGCWWLWCLLSPVAIELRACLDALIDIRLLANCRPITADGSSAPVTSFAASPFHPIRLNSNLMSRLMACWVQLIWRIDFEFHVSTETLSLSLSPIIKSYMTRTAVNLKEMAKNSNSIVDNLATISKFFKIFKQSWKMPHESQQSASPSKESRTISNYLQNIVGTFSILQDDQTSAKNLKCASNIDTIT